MTPSIRIRLNGQERDIPEGSSIADLLQLAGYGERRVAVERNGEIVPRSQHAQTPVAAGDHLEVVHAIGGG